MFYNFYLAEEELKRLNQALAEENHYAAVGFSYEQPSEQDSADQQPAGRLPLHKASQMDFLTTAIPKSLPFHRHYFCTY